MLVAAVRQQRGERLNVLAYYEAVGQPLAAHLEWLRKIVSDSRRPIVFIFAGKAHPADMPGQDLIREVQRVAREPEFEGRLLLVEDYDMGLARRLVSGCDIWLNNPIYPFEASGTSGMKAAINGTINLSVLDGWWAEGYDGDNGWAFGWKDPHADHEAADRHDADDFYRVLADEVAPLFYERTADGIPEKWVERMRSAITSSIVQFSSHRMVAEYVDRAYSPLV